MMNELLFPIMLLIMIEKILLNIFLMNLFQIIGTFLSIIVYLITNSPEAKTIVQIKGAISK